VIAQLLLPLVPWVVFGVAAGVLLWRFTKVVRRRDLNTLTGSDQFREMLERIWVQSPSSR
jgi:hypothetical protein